MERIDIVIPIYNALTDVERCVDSVLEHSVGFEITLILVNDASAKATTEYLRELNQSEPRVHLIESRVNQGYSASSNLGLQASTTPYVVLMNSDIIVTQRWLDKLLRCAESSEDIGIVSPVTNAAIWQSVPNIPDSSLLSTINYPHLGEIERFADCVEALSTQAYPELPHIHGFCQLIKREVIEAIGYIDAENYANGMGSELEYCFRAADEGFRSVVADDTFIYHSKAKSLNKKARAQSNWYQHSVKKFGKERCDDSAKKIYACSVLDALRDATSFHIFRRTLSSTIEPFSIAVLVDNLEKIASIEYLYEMALLWQQQGMIVHFMLPHSSQALRLPRPMSASYKTEQLVWLAYGGVDQAVSHLRYYDVVVTQDTDALGVLKKVAADYPEILTVLLEDKKQFQSACLAGLENSLFLVNTMEERKALSACVGKRVFAIDSLQDQLSQDTKNNVIIDFFRKKRSRHNQQADSLLLLLKDSLLYHRKNHPPVAFSKGTPPLADITVISHQLSMKTMGI